VEGETLVARAPKKLVAALREFKPEIIRLLEERSVLVDVPCTCDEKPFPHFRHADGTGPGSGRGLEPENPRQAHGRRRANATTPRPSRKASLCPACRALYVSHFDDGSAVCDKCGRRIAPPGGKVSTGAACYVHGAEATWWRRGDGSSVCGLCHPPIGSATQRAVLSDAGRRT
jgi:ribosomal protein L37AE/L43A